MKSKELQGDLVAQMRTWQKLEHASVVSAEQIVAETDNQVIRLVTTRSCRSWRRSSGGCSRAESARHSLSMPRAAWQGPPQ